MFQYAVEKQAYHRCRNCEDQHASPRWPRYADEFQ